MSSPTGVPGRGHEAYAYVNIFLLNVPANSGGFQHCAVFISGKARKFADKTAVAQRLGCGLAGLAQFRCKAWKADDALER
jgi:hypothetical protein